MTALFVLLMVLPMILTGVFKLWALFWVFVTFNCIFGVIEIVSKKITGKTVSQSFWIFIDKNRVKGILILVSMVLMWATLIVHLGFKVF